MPWPGFQGPFEGDQVDPRPIEEWEREMVPEPAEPEPPVQPVTGQEGLTGLVADDMPWPPPEWQQEPEAVPFLRDDAEPAAEPEVEPDPRLPGEMPSLQVDPLEHPAPPPEMLREDEFDQEMRRQLGLSPEEHVADRARREHDRQRLAYDQTMELVEASRQAQEEAMRDWQDASRQAQQRMQQIDRNVQELSQQRIDPEQWWGDRSTPQRMAGYATAIIGGLMAPHRGGVNSGLDFIQQQIDRDIQAQAANLDHQRAALGQQQGIVAEMYRLSGDEFQAQEAARIASMEMAAMQMEAELQAFDSRGTAAAAGVQAIGEMRASAAEARQAMEDREREQILEFNKERRAEESHQMQLQRFQREMMQPVGGVGVPEAPVGETVVDPNTGEELPIGHERVVANPRTGDFYVARNEDKAKEVGERLSGYAAARDAAQELREFAQTADTTATAGGGTRFTGQSQQDFEAIRHRLARNLARAHRGMAAGRGDIEAQLKWIPTHDTWFDRADAEVTIRREIAAMDREINMAMRDAGIDPAQIDHEAGEPVPGREEGIQENLEPTEHRILRDNIRGTPISELGVETLAPLASPPVGKDPEATRAAMDANIGAMSEKLEEALGERDEAQATEDHGRAREAEERVQAIRELLEQAHGARQRAHRDVRRREIPEEIREGQRRMHAPDWAMPGGR